MPACSRAWGEHPFPQPRSAGGAAAAGAGLPVGTRCFSGTELRGAGAALALGEKLGGWKITKKKKKFNPTENKCPGGDYFLQSPVVVDNGTDWNNFSEWGKARVALRCCWILLLDTGVPIN